MFYLWLTIVILLLVVELLTTEYKTIWFVISAFSSMLLTFIVDDFIVQFLVFFIFGVILLFIMRPFLINRKRKKLKEGIEGTTITKITKNKPGSVKIGNITYTAKSKIKIDVDKKVVLKKVLDDLIEVEEKQNS